MEKNYLEEKLILRDEKILVVDDIPKWIQIARNNLNYYGCPSESIRFSDNIADAFKEYEKKKTTFILTDINFDKENLEDTQGLDLINMLREDGYIDLVVAMSSLEEIAQESKDAGANYFIDKRTFVEGMDNFVKWYCRYKKIK